VSTAMCRLRPVVGGLLAATAHVRNWTLVGHPGPGDDGRATLRLRVDGQARAWPEQMRHEHAGAGGKRLDDLADDCDQLQLSLLFAQVHGLVLGAL